VSATSLDAFLSFLSTSLRCSGKRSSSLLPVPPMMSFRITCACYAIDEIGGGACKRSVISIDRLDPVIVNERTSIASFALAL